MSNSIEKLKEAKEKISKEILNILSNFEKEFGVSVQEVRLVHVNTMRPSKPITADVSLHVSV